MSRRTQSNRPACTSDGSSDPTGLTAYCAHRIAETIIARSGSRRFATTDALRQWIRLEFGVRIRAEKVDVAETGRLERSDRDGALEIVFNVAQRPKRQMRILIHELAEWICFTRSGVADEIQPLKALPDALPANFRHDVAVEVEERVARIWQIDDYASSFSVYDRLRIASPYGACPAKYTLGDGQPEAECADPLEDACL
ncbi:MAG: hypothetical protein P4L33_19050 [Capsulimonadaceae bacterium]|nr:hypothetical protein [Capsulimonadaceae bacterium]